MTLRYLVFDFSEDALGHGSFDAMACAAPDQRPALEAEVVAVLDWAHRAFPQARAPLEEGGEWDYALHGLLETARPLSVDYEFGGTRLRMQPGPPGPPRLTLDFTLTGAPPFCEAFRSAFDIS